MTNKETIQVLQSIEDRAVDFPNMTACDWVAIAAAKRHLQEEPTSIWHDANEKPNIKEKGGIFVITSLYGEYIGSRYYNYNDITITLGNYDKWAYLNDLLNLSNVQRTVKNRKEPISEDLEKIVEEIVEPTILNAYGAKELARRLRNTICSTSVSEDLEEASKAWLIPKLDKSYELYGESKMMELTKFDGYSMLDAIKFGVNWQKQLMMKNAVECDVIRKDDGLADLRWKDENGLKKLTSNLNNGDKVKVIIIKED